MLNTRLLSASLLALALTACGPADETDGTAGSGGGGGADGGGGVGGDTETPVVECAGSRILELDGSTSPAILQDELDPVDGWSVSCAPGDNSGNDALIRFRAGQAGPYRISTEGTGFDTVLYALKDCNDGFTELACNDDWAGGRHSQLLLEMEEGEEVYLVIDAVGARQPMPFTLSATLLQVDPPEIGDIAGFHNRSAGTTGVRLSGTSPESPLVGFSMQLYTSNGAQILPAPYRAVFSERSLLTLTEEDGRFQVEGSFALGDGAPAVGRIEITVIDRNGLESEAASSTARSPDAIARGEVCDPNRALNVCAATDACVVRAPETKPHCSVATAPTFQGGTATVNLETGFLGVVVEGIDPESDVSALRLLPRNASGGALAVASGATVVDLHRVTHDAEGAFRGVLAMEARFDGKCLGPAQSYLNDCINRGGNQQACYDEAIARLYACYADTLAQVATVEVEVVDETGRVSQKLSLDVSPTDSAVVGGSCDPFGATGACEEGLICWADTSLVPETCHETGPICPEGFGAIDLADHVSDGKWRYTGDNSAAVSREGGSCGGAGPTDAFAFTAPSAGTWKITTSHLGPRSNTVLYVRPFCQLPAYELACNDDTGLSAASALEIQLAEGETVYIFVGSALDPSGNPATGRYTLTVSGI